MDTLKEKLISDVKEIARQEIDILERNVESAKESIEITKAKVNKIIFDTMNSIGKLPTDTYDTFVKLTNGAFRIGECESLNGHAYIRFEINNQDVFYNLYNRFDNDIKLPVGKYRVFVAFFPITQDKESEKNKGVD